MTSHGLRLGVYADLRYEPGPDGVRCDTAFVRFIAALGRHTEELVVFGRAGRVSEAVATLRSDEAEFVPLPDYRSLAAVGSVARALRPSRAAWMPALESLDALLVFGPHPLAITMVSDARRLSVPTVLGVRQDLPRYLARRASARARPAVLATAWGLELSWRRLARRHPTVVTGDQLARAYSGAELVLDLTFSLVTDDDVVDPATREWPLAPPLRALSVGRLDPEKNPILLASIAARLRDTGSDWTLRVVGTGSEASALADRCRELGLDGRIELVGTVPHGPELRAEYEAADAFLHVSLTEGRPQVLLEAMATGLPVVGTAVGGVPDMLGRGERGLLIPPVHADAAVDSLERIRADPALRTRLTDAARDYVRARTVELEAERLVALLAATTRGSR